MERAEILSILPATSACAQRSIFVAHRDCFCFLLQPRRKLGTVHWRMGRAAWHQGSTRHRNQGQQSYRSRRRGTHPIAQYTTNYVRGNDNYQQKVLYTGNSVKSMHISLEASLKKLRTSYIDIFYLHWWDWETSIEEVMNGLHNLVQQGKVLYLVHVKSSSIVVASHFVPTFLGGF